ncbi:MAG: hypothetical protein MJ078_02135, partial [Clostridia bacterium]|nr:hypothetical protein [Clostridia bacterium]
IGVFHICFAMIVKALCYTKRFGFRESVSVWGWLLLIVGSLSTVILSMALTLPISVTKWTLIAIAGISALGIYIFNTPGRNPLINIGAGLWETYNMATGILGDVPETFEEYTVASQISQAEALKYFIERMRTQRPLKSGILWWNLLDGWPQMSDAVTDYYFEKKLAYYYIKRSQAPFIFAMDEIKDFNLRLVACNDSLLPRTGKVKVSDASDGKTVYENTFTAPANTSTVIAPIYTMYSEHKILLIRWETEEGVGHNHYLCGMPPFDFRIYRDLMEKIGLNSETINEERDK